MRKKSEQKIDNVFVYEDQELKKLQKQYAEIDKSGIDMNLKHFYVHWDMNYHQYMRKKGFQREEY